MRYRYVAPYRDLKGRYVVEGLVPGLGWTPQFSLRAKNDKEAHRIASAVHHQQYMAGERCRHGKPSYMPPNGCRECRIDELRQAIERHERYAREYREKLSALGGES